jgi:hypothetical protein
MINSFSLRESSVSRGISNAEKGIEYLKLRSWLKNRVCSIRNLFLDIESRKSGDHESILPCSISLDLLDCTIMRWPSWSTRSSEKDLDDTRPPKRPDAAEVDQTYFTDPRNVIATVLLTGGSLLSIRYYKLYLRRIPEAVNIPTIFFRKRSVFGRVTSVGDGDNFRVFHTPGGRLAGWGWFPGRKVPVKREDLKSQTVSYFVEFSLSITQF